MLSTNDIRTRFLGFFRERGHTVVPSSPLVPDNDPTLLFVNSGMVQFKNTFLGQERRNYDRAVTSQRCIRAGGKHNDLENVGYTARHHTFFEMLGNFSFGDYFKRDAIAYAWEFLTREMGLPAEKLWVTVYEEDSDAEAIWLNEIGVSPERFSRIGAADNFWSMGDIGPCGPCSEIFYDHGPEVPGGPPGTPEEDGDRYVEIWNLVFMQYDRAADGTMTALPAPSVDTGMGLERMAAVMQGVHDNYEIDLFQGLMAEAARALEVENDGAASLKVIADHIRATAFLITDGVLPGKEGRGYVLRRIMRRAIRHGFNRGQDKPFLHRLVAPLVTEMGAASPELSRAREHVERVILQEEERFAETLSQGMALLESALGTLEGDVIPGDVVFKLYDTYGFPVDLTADIARERGLTVDMEVFEQEMAAQRERARAANRFEAQADETVRVAQNSEFTGYEHFQDHGRVVALIHDGQEVDFLTEGREAMVVLDRTPFYAEGGGQVGDRGWLETDGARFAVSDTHAQASGAHLHIGRLEQGRLALGDSVRAELDAPARRATMRNHTATHLLHAALKQVLGQQVTQRGSLVAPDRLRFDFSHEAPVSREQLAEIEHLVNEQILANMAGEITVTSYDDAMAAGAVALFGEKYGERVRMLRLGDFSTELCGGTHCQRTGDIGLFKITSESGVASGIRRMEAVTGEAALRFVENGERRLSEVAGLMRAGREDVLEKTEQTLTRLRELEKQVQALNAKMATQRGGELAEQAREIDGVKVLAARLDGVDAKTLREIADKLKDQLGSAVVVLATVKNGKVSLLAGITKEQTAELQAGELVNFVAGQVGGRGGGRPDMAQAGGQQPEKLDAALASVEPWVRERLQGKPAQDSTPVSTKA
jgi:alanyl-tRNA synthetase